MQPVREYHQQLHHHDHTFKHLSIRFGVKQKHRVRKIHHHFNLLAHICISAYLHHMRTHSVPSIVTAIIL